MASAKRGLVFDGPSNKRRSSSAGPSSGTKYNVSTSNKFELLNTKNYSKIKKVNSLPKPAPIVITNGVSAALKDALSKLNIKYYMKLQSVGTKFFFETIEHRNIFEQFIKTADCEFYSHPSSNDKNLKIVLGGLPEIDPDAIIEDLSENYNISPLKISAIKSNRESKLYLLFFDRNEVSKYDITKIKYVYGHVAKWLPYVRKSRGPTQCFRCGMFGHGMSFCSRKTACLLCGDAHETKSCLFNEQQATSNAVFKCVNCKMSKLQYNHRADSDECPSRRRYVEIRQNTNSRNNGRRNHVINSSQNATSNINILPSTSSFAQIVKQKRPAPPPSSDSDVWSFEEVSSLLINCLKDLSKCRNKFEQLEVIANLIKHAIK